MLHGRWDEKLVWVVLLSCVMGRYWWQVNSLPCCRRCPSY